MNKRLHDASTDSSERGAKVATGYQISMFFSGCVCPYKYQPIEFGAHAVLSNGAPHAWAENIYFGHKILMKPSHDCSY